MEKTSCERRNKRKLNYLLADIPNEQPSTCSFSKKSKMYTIQNFILIWLDFNTNKLDENYQNIVAQLKRIINVVKIFSDVDECVDFLTDIKDEKVFIIMSDVHGQQLISRIYNIRQIYSIYIYCRERVEYDEFMVNSRKVKGIFTQIEYICDALKRDTKQCDHDTSSISIISPDDYLKQNPNELEPLFMYSQILKEIVLDIEHNDQEKNELIQLWREQYRHNESQLKIIDQFERDYTPKSAIWWYTKEVFTYSMLNRALRTVDIDIFIKMGFFLRDVHRQIEQLYVQQSKTRMPLTVYRGQAMVNSQFEKLRNSEGGLLSFNNFLSTSTDPQVSKLFCPTPTENSEITGILFEIKVDPSITSVVFASLDGESNFHGEQEILFSMHTIFRIGKTTEIEKGIWGVLLTLTKDNDEELNVLTARLREETLGSTGWHRLGQLMIRMGEPNKAEELYQILLNSIPANDDVQLTHIYNQLGAIKIHQGNLNQALLFYQKTIEIKEKYLLHSHPSTAIIYNNIGLVHQQLGNYSDALTFYQKALEIYQNFLDSDHLLIATAYGNIGLVYEHITDYANALSFLQKSLDIRQKSLPSNHPEIAITFNSIGHVYNAMGEYSNALTHHENALQIQQKSLLSNHFDLATTYSNIADVYDNMGNYATALLFYQKALEIEKKSLPSNHIHLAITYSNIGLIYDNMGDHSDALSFYQKTLEIQQEWLPSDHPNLAITYNNIGGTYDNMENYSNAFLFYKKALNIDEKVLHPNHPDLAITFCNIGLVYNNTEDYSNALLFHKKALEIQQKSLSTNHPDLATTYSNIGLAYDNLEDYSNALSFYQKVLEIDEKSLPPNHPDRATTYNNIASTYDNLGDHESALFFFRKTLEIEEKSLPSNHLSLGITYKNIGLAYNNIKDYSNALLFFERALSIKRHSLPENHPQLQSLREKIATLQTKL